MTTLKSILVISIVAFLSFTEYTGASSFSLRPRMYRRGKADIVKELLQAIGVFTEDKSVNAWVNLEQCLYSSIQLIVCIGFSEIARHVRSLHGD
jgi:hypothetical protein